MTHPDEAQRAEVQARFGQYAQGYVTSPTHANGEDLAQLVRLLGPQPGWRVLDVATGGGHTALAVARHGAVVVASDLTHDMLRAAQAFVVPHKLPVSFALADAAALPFGPGTFDAVTCRIAAHHFPDVFAFVRGAVRVLRPGGVLVVQDQVVPDDPLSAQYLNAFERLRDPSHARILSHAEWQGTFLDAGMVVDDVQDAATRDTLRAWASRQGCPPDVVARLQVLLTQAPAQAKAWQDAQCAGTPDASFLHCYIIIRGHKPPA